MRCPNCNSEHNTKNSICAVCGYDFDNPSEKAPMDEITDKAAPAKSKKSINTTTAILGAIVVALSGILVYQMTKPDRQLDGTENTLSINPTSEIITEDVSDLSTEDSFLLSTETSIDYSIAEDTEKLEIDTLNMENANSTATQSEDSPDDPITGRIDTEWGWYEMAPGYEQYRFDYGSIYTTDGETLPKAMFCMQWDFAQKCFTNENSQTGLIEPMVYCSTTDIASLDGSYSLPYPSYVGEDLLTSQYNYEFKLPLYPETLQDCVKYCIDSYDERPWGQMLDLYHEAMMMGVDSQLSQSAFAELYSTSFDGVSNVWYAMISDMIYENPYAFNVISQDGIFFKGKMDENGMYYYMPDYQLSMEEYQSKLDVFVPAWENYMQTIRSLTDGKTSVDTALIVADYICQNCTYDASLTKRSAYDGLIEGTTVCMGYTQWFNSTMSELGYDVTYVQSNDMNHVWSAVYFPEYGDWFEIDVTWMDGSFTINNEIFEGTDIKYFGFSSRDYSAYYNHYCTDQKSYMIYQKNPPLSFCNAKGWGYGLIGSGWTCEASKSVTYIDTNTFEITGYGGEVGTLNLG